MPKTKKKSRRPSPDIVVSGVHVEQRPLSAQTMKRIEAGLKKFFGKKISFQELVRKIKEGRRT